MLDLTALPRILKTSATWMQSRRGKGASYSTLSADRMEKNRAPGAKAGKTGRSGTGGRNCWLL